MPARAVCFGPAAADGPGAYYDHDWLPSQLDFEFNLIFPSPGPGGDRLWFKLTASILSEQLELSTVTPWHDHDNDFQDCLSRLGIFRRNHTPGDSLLVTRDDRWTIDSGWQTAGVLLAQAQAIWYSS